MIHLHVRDKEGAHTLDVGRYRDAISAIRDEVGDDIVIQVTSEAVGIYNADQQIEMVVELQPEAVSLAIREIVPGKRRRLRFSPKCRRVILCRNSSYTR